MANIFSDPNSRSTIIVGTSICALTGGLVGSSYAILKYIRPIRKPALAMAGSWGIAGLSFFVIRQVLLQKEYRKNSMYNIKPSQTKDIDEITSSSLSGVITGGLFGGLVAIFKLNLCILGGKKGCFAGMAFFGIIGYSIQKVYTKLYRHRQRIILENMGLKVIEEESPEYDTSSYAARISRISQINVLSVLPNWLPIKSLSHDEYIQILDVRQNEIIERLNQIEKELYWIEKNSTE
ncbi:hypothetical protein BB561_004194 [Smittium simulii]|uniref:Uncharacterized protein n=1 Tax=Smittium simulii TaxID=133385 RepID=A0A2T9YHK9_9FUNG|nr:hypothetical protein BB561_004194 [Smittium simulii]